MLRQITHRVGNNSFLKAHYGFVCEPTQ